VKFTCRKHPLLTSHIQAGKLSRVGVRYEAHNAPTLEVLFGLLQLHPAFRG
jgi:hypothetical protein